MGDLEDMGGKSEEQWLGASGEWLEKRRKSATSLT
jgi:hypothetical protein